MYGFSVTNSDDKVNYFFYNQECDAIEQFMNCLQTKLSKFEIENFSIENPYFEDDPETAEGQWSYALISNGKEIQLGHASYFHQLRNYQKSLKEIKETVKIAFGKLIEFSQKTFHSFDSLISEYEKLVKVYFSNQSSKSLNITDFKFSFFNETNLFLNENYKE